MIPAIVKDVVVLTGRAQVPALLASVTVTVAPVVDPTAEQLVNWPPSARSSVSPGW